MVYLRVELEVGQVDNATRQFNVKLLDIEAVFQEVTDGTLQ